MILFTVSPFFQIESVSGTLVLRWVNSQLGRILGWVERAIAQEVKLTVFFLCYAVNGMNYEVARFTKPGLKWVPCKHCV